MGSSPFTAILLFTPYDDITPVPKSLPQRVLQTILRFQMIHPKERIIVAVSGGIDSVTCLNLLYKLQGDLDISLSVAHVNHGLRGRASEEDESFVAKLAAFYGLPFERTRIDIVAFRAKNKRTSPEEAARILRYRFFEELLDKGVGHRVALAHQQDDQAETMLMTLLTGGGRLSPIPPCRGAFIRPLIEIARCEIESYAKTQRLEFREDLSNKDIKYLRNQIRHELLPLLKSDYNPQIDIHLAKLAGRLYLEKKHFRDMIGQVWHKVVIDIHTSRAVLDLEAFLELSEILREHLLIELMAKIGISGGGDKHLSAILNLASSASPHQSLHLPDGARVIRSYNRIVFSHQPQSPCSSYVYELSISKELKLPEAGLRMCADFMGRMSIPAGSFVERFDVQQISFPLTVRNFRTGDRFQPLGMQGHKKVKNLFIDRKIPHALRHSTPILLSQEEILWVIGIQRSMKACITPHTQGILEVACWSEAYS